MNVLATPIMRYIPSVSSLAPVSHQISMMTAHISPNRRTVFKPLQWPCTFMLPFMVLSLKFLAEFFLNTRLT